MSSYDALIVGGGPAGSTCARALRRAGWNVAVLDRARFPRDKVCAGWVTPAALRAIELDPAEYRATGRTIAEITGFRTGVMQGPLLDTAYPDVVSYAIRRCEFDEFLLRRADVAVHEGVSVTELRWRGDVWIVNDTYEAPVLIGAGGHFCPVARHLRGTAPAPDPVIAQEAEFAIDASSSSVESSMPELFFCRDLEGYGWCVRKGEYLNVGLGRREAEGFAAHRRDFVAFLERSGKAPGASAAKWRGHAYYASGAGGPLIGDGVLLIGDAAGLACPESGEGIRPAIEAGRLAAETLIAAGGPSSIDRLRPYEGAIRRVHPPVARWPAAARPITTVIGRALLRSHAFTRHVVIDRWFLGAAQHS